MKVRAGTKYERFHRIQSGDLVEPCTYICDGCGCPTEWRVDRCKRCEDEQTHQEWFDELDRTMPR
jgi:hypothetical protein